MSDMDSPKAGGSAHCAATAPARQAEQTTAVSEAREQRITDLRRRYQDGSYQVDAAGVSASIVEKHLRR